MSPLGRLLRRALARIRSADLRARLPDMMDADLVGLVDEYLANDSALRALLERDGRDTDDISALAPVADRQAELLERIAGTPAKGLAGLLVKARAVRLRPFQVGYDGVATLGWSLAGDVLRLFDRPA